MFSVDPTPWFGQCPNIEFFWEASLFKLKTGKMSTLTEHELIALIFKSGYPGRPTSGHSG